jgi:hypothetical protein
MPIDGRLELVSEAGIYTSQSGVGFGLGGAARTGPVVAGVTGVVGGRIPTFGTPISERAGIGLATVELELRFGAEPGLEPVGLVALLDAAALDPAERDCVNEQCRMQYFTAVPTKEPTLGLGVQPAFGLRVLGGVGGDGVHSALLLGLQPTHFYDAQVWFLPRVDLTVWRADRPWSIRWWAGRYGTAVGFGYALSSPRRR